MSNNFNPGFDREKEAFIELANRGDGLAPINYLYAKEANFENMLSAFITGGTADVFTLYSSGIYSNNIQNLEDIITQKLKWSNLSNDYYVGFTAGNLTKSTLWTLPLEDGTYGQVLATNGTGILSFIDITSQVAPSDGTYIIGTPNPNLPDARVLEELGTGMAKIIADGNFAIAIPGVDYATTEQLEDIRLNGFVDSDSNINGNIHTIRGPDCLLTNIPAGGDVSLDANRLINVADPQEFGDAVNLNFLLDLLQDNVEVVWE